MSQEKTIGFAYATSDIAKYCRKYKTGCWFVAIVDGTGEVVANQVEFASESKADVCKFALSIELPYNRYSMHTEEYK